MKILHTADWHIGQFKGPVVDGVNLRSQDTVKCLEYMVQVAIEEKPDIVCVSGDIFHQEQVGPVRYSDEMITATNIITSLAHFSKYVIVMRGTPNHDGAAQFRVLERMLLNIRNVDVVTEPGVIKTPWADIACLPGFDKQEFRAKFPGLSADEENLAWTKYISDMVFALRAECEKTPILMAHYTVPGCNMESGQTSFFTNFEPVIPREALMAARYEAVLLGHIHRPQIIEGLDNVFYSGAINAMNFNDEGQDRGFWIHEFNEKGTLVRGHKYTTPYRQFHTITWDPDEVGDYIREGAMYLHRTGISEDVTDKIVRVRYSCTSEQKKALNIPLLQKNLYELGAFYVADIEAESTIDITNRGLLSEESDPRLNLKKWLEEKTFKNPDKIVELAEPIIRRLMAQYWQQAQFLQFLQQIRWKLLSSRLCELLRSQRMKPWILRLKRSFLEYLGMFRQIRLQLWHHRSMALQRLPTARKLRAVPKKKTMKIITKESMLNSKIRSSMSRMMLTILSGPKKFQGLEIVL